ncbi:DUF692 family multinuclear iron-containing protein [Dyadobacter sp. 32]|uniref:multinuclear nonheme iron-dependent oxidase n=1 Tax=Dyadobacter sp. 32 TaxID=538966 RepID=UPI0011EF0697
MNRIYASIACNLDAGILSAALPLFEGEKVQAIEWAFDTLFQYEQIPDWFTDLVTEYSDQGRLVGHGVFFSLFSGRWSVAQQEWLDRLRRMCETFRFDHITEHFGFMTGVDFHKGAPISVPFTEATLALGRDRLRRIQDACRCPVGLENLAFSYTLDEVKYHGDFLEKLILPTNGFIILDLHNLYCQLHNFNIADDTLLNLYPLDRVREIHISGGSWVDHDPAPKGRIRRDTHDDAVPEEVFHLLRKVLNLCPKLKFVVMEQLGTALETEQSHIQFRRDFYKMDLIVQNHNRGSSARSTNDFLPEYFDVLTDLPLEVPELYEQQVELSLILERAVGTEDARNLLSRSSLAKSDWQVENWTPHMLETAIAIAKKWQ